MKPSKKKLDGYMAVFNCHVNSAEIRAQKEFIQKYGLSIWTREIQPIIDSGIMSIFQQGPNEWTQFYVDTITRIVNEDRESEDDPTLALKRAAIKSMEESERATMTLPTASTIVNVFPGDLRDWFAGQAMSGILSGSESEYGGYSTCDLLAKVSYQTADAMLKARATSTGENG